MTEILLAVLGLLLPLVLLGPYLKSGGKVFIFFLALGLGYFSALPIGFLNGIIINFFGNTAMGVGLSVVTEEGFKGLLFYLLLVRKNTNYSTFIWLGGALWSGFAFFELLLRLFSGISPGEFGWMPGVLHVAMGLIWGGIASTRIIPPAMSKLFLLEPFFYHFLFNSLLIQGLWFPAGGIFIFLGGRILFLLNPPEKN